MFNRVPDVDVAQAQKLLADGAMLLDVRRADEWQAGHAPQALHVPLDALPQRIGEVPTDRRVVAVCRSGARSARATKFLRGQGVDAVNLDGGMQAWARSGGDVVGAGGHHGYIS
ncbi:MAG TPA: rhodanese-like domain-containing protein [Euzebyales bacterium]